MRRLLVLGFAMAACIAPLSAAAQEARADMHPNVIYVPAGVVQIVQRQQQGWAYLRP